MPLHQKHLAIYLPDMSGGGAERLHLALMDRFHASGVKITLLLHRVRGELLAQLPHFVDVIDMDVSGQLGGLLKLKKTLTLLRPDALISNMEHMNITAVLANALASSKTKVIVTQHCAFSEQARRNSWKYRVLPILSRWILPFAEHIVAVSEGVADDLSMRAKIGREKIAVIFNGVDVGGITGLPAPPVPHPWCAANRPIVIAMGRLVPQKGFRELIAAFQSVLLDTNARLLILGEGPERQALERLITINHLADRIALVGFVDQPASYLAHADLFVLSSKYEGFGNVLVEALASGVPIVSTDCPFGPAEILENGKFGRLVAVGDERGLAEAIVSTLSEKHDHSRLQERAAHFSLENCAKKYLELIS